MELPKNENTFIFKSTGNATKKPYEGRFTVVCSLNTAQRYQVELEKTRLMADYRNPTDGLMGLAIVLSNLRVRITDAPEWWKQSNEGFGIDDENVLVELYDETLKAEEKWRQTVITAGETKTTTEEKETNKDPS